MPLMQEAMSKENFERMEKGLSPLKPKKTTKPEPEFPKIDNQLKFKDIPLDKFEKLISAKRKTIRNEEGVMFIGMDVVIELKGKRGPGRPKENAEEPQHETVSGWMIEGDWHELYRYIREKIDLNKIAW